MRRLVYVALALFIIVGIFTGCKSASFEPKYLGYTSPMLDELQEGSQQVFIADNPSEVLEAEIKTVYTELCSFYGVEKELPKIRQMTEEQFMASIGGLDGTGFYDYKSQTIYVVDTLTCDSIQCKNTIAHELLHYLSDNGSRRGFIYQKDGKLFNKYFNEGVTEYLASRFVDKKVAGPYDFQRTLAEQIGIVVGEEMLEKAYFSSDDSEVRKLFNDAVSDIYTASVFDDVEFEPFDEFASNFYSLWILGCNDQIEAQGLLFSHLEEEVIYFASKNKLTKKVQASLRDLFDDWDLDTYIANELFDYSYLRSIS